MQSVRLLLKKKDLGDENDNVPTSELSRTKMHTTIIFVSSSSFCTRIIGSASVGF